MAQPTFPLYGLIHPPEGKQVMTKRCLLYWSPTYDTFAKHKHEELYKSM